MRDRLHVAVIGAREATPEAEGLAEQVGRGIAERGGIVVCGGLTGVMAGACRGAKGAGGTTIGILPGGDRDEANRWVDVAIPTGLGEVRNVLVVRASDAVIAIGGAHGTLSEIAFALKLGRAVVALRSWTLTPYDADDADDPGPGVTVVDSPEDAVETAFTAAGPGAQPPPSPA